MRWLIASVLTTCLLGSWAVVNFNGYFASGAVLGIVYGVSITAQLYTPRDVDDDERTPV